MSDNDGMTSHQPNHDDDYIKLDGSKKRRFHGENDHNLQQQTNKRRKNNKKGGKNKKKNKGQQQYAKKQKKQNNNWIESCSDSVGRIPANCAAPLTCIITRVEIDEEPLLPKGVKGDAKRDGDGKDVSADGCNTSVDENKGKDGTDIHKVQTIAAADAKTATPSNLTDMLNIAKPSTEFVSQYKKERVPWKIPPTVEVDNQQKKVFIAVKRHKSAIGPTKWAIQRKKSGKQQSFNHCHLPGGDNGDGMLNPYPSVPDKFWAQRKRLFSRYDEGIQIGGEEDPEMWYSVTPESIANHVSERTIKMIRESQSNASEDTPGTDDPCTTTPEITILDVFCGCGGNVIAFARHNITQIRDYRVKVIAVDNNLSRLKMAANNAAIYNIDRDAICFIHADAIEVLNHYSKGSHVSRTEEIEFGSNTKHTSGFAMGGIELLPNNLDGIFLSPPWGGMDYGNQTSCGKAGFNPVTSITVQSSSKDTSTFKEGSDNKYGKDGTVKTNGGELLSIATKAVFNDSEQAGVIAYFLPRNTDGISLGQIGVASGIKGSFEMEQNVVNGKVKTVTAYFSQGAGEHT